MTNDIIWAFVAGFYVAVFVVITIRLLDIRKEMKNIKEARKVLDRLQDMSKQKLLNAEESVTLLLRLHTPSQHQFVSNYLDEVELEKNMVQSVSKSKRSKA